MGPPNPDEKPKRPDIPNEDNALAKTNSSHELVEGNKRLFDNYPHSLRELALKARSFARARAEEVSGFAQGATGSRSGSPRNSPTQEDLLRIARGFWTRMRIRFKWFTIRGFRRFNIDELSAFFTLGGLGTAIWVIVGTYVYRLTQNYICFSDFRRTQPIKPTRFVSFPLTQNTSH